MTAVAPAPPTASGAVRRGGHGEHAAYGQSIRTHRQSRSPPRLLVHPKRRRQWRTTPALRAHREPPSPVVGRAGSARPGQQNLRSVHAAAPPQAVPPTQDAARCGRSRSRGAAPRSCANCLDVAVVGEDQPSVIEGDRPPPGQGPLPTRCGSVEDTGRCVVRDEDTRCTGCAQLDSVTNGIGRGCEMSRFAHVGSETDAQHRRRGGTGPAASPAN